MATPPLFSVCMVTYNHEKYIQRAIESVIKQKHNYSYELIVSDDCSTDSTKLIIEKLAKKYPSIIKPIFNQRNLGPMKNYYQTLNMCNGKYTLFCDGDDYWQAEKKKKQISFLEENTFFDFCYSEMTILNSNNKEYLSDVYLLSQCDSILSCGGTADLFAYIIKDGNYENIIQPK